MTFQQFVDKMLKDKKFRTAVRLDPKQALIAAGMKKPTPQQVNALKKVNYGSLNRVASAFHNKNVT
jgi:hypothetical protein